MNNKKRPSNYHKLFRTSNMKEIKGARNQAQIQFINNQFRDGNHSIVYILKGPAGVGKTATCFNIAQVVNCQHPVDPITPCGACKSCSEALTHPNTNLDIMVINGALDNSVDNVRELIEKIKLKNPFYNKFCIIIDEWHRLSGAALEGLLGIFEDARIGSTEEECNYMFLLPTTSIDNIPPALLTRAQILDFSPLTKSELREYLIEKCDFLDIEYEEEAFDLIFDRTNGGVRKSLQLLEKIAVTNDYFVSVEATEKEVNADKSVLAPKLFKSILKLQTAKALKLAKNHNSELGVRENDFNDLFELFDEYADSEDCIYDDRCINECLEIISKGRDSFINNTSIRRNDDLSVTIRSLITSLKEGTLRKLEETLASRNHKYSTLLFAQFPTLKFEDEQLILLLNEPTEAGELSYLNKGLKASFVKKVFSSLNIEGHSFR